MLASLTPPEGHQKSQKNTPEDLYFQYVGIPHPVGAGAVVAIPGERPYPGERTHALALSSIPPHTLDRGGYTPVGVGQTGRGHPSSPRAE
jgi:hypothetical protein